MMSWIGCGGKRPWPNSRYYPDRFVKGLRKTTKNLRIADLRTEIPTWDHPKT
jgi:hypothetical protein